MLTPVTLHIMLWAQPAKQSKWQTFHSGDLCRQNLHNVLALRGSASTISMFTRLTHTRLTHNALIFSGRCSCPSRPGPAQSRAWSARYKDGSRAVGASFNKVHYPSSLWSIITLPLEGEQSIVTSLSVGLFVCWSVCEHISRTTCPNFAKCCAFYLWLWLGPYVVALLYNM